MLHLLKYIEWANFISHCDQREQYFTIHEVNYFTFGSAEYFTKIGLSSNPYYKPQKISFPISRRLTLRAKRRKIKFTFAARRFCRGGYQPPAFFGRIISSPTFFREDNILPYFEFREFYATPIGILRNIFPI